MSVQEGFLNKVQNILQQDYRGVNIAVYALAAAGLAVSIHRIRPVSKFSKAANVPKHFLRNHEPLRGIYVGVTPSPVRLLIDHKAPLYLPFWHSSKPPLPVKLWGVDVVSGNAVSWIDCVARGCEVTLKPIEIKNEDLVSTVVLHLPQAQTLDVGKKLVELGFAKAEVPNNIKKNTIESQLAPILLSAEAHAKSYRNGIWSDVLPPLPIYIVYWRKGKKYTTQAVVYSTKALAYAIILVSRGAITGLKYVVSLPFRASRKQVQAT